MDSLAVVLERPEHLVLRQVGLLPAGSDDVVVDVAFSGISTGTERLLWSGRMPPFPGMGYPLVPGYESVGRVSAAGATSGRRIGDFVFVPGSRGFRDARGLFGGAAARLVAAGSKVIPVGEELGASGVLLALAATAQHTISVSRHGLPELIVGHGVLGRLLARLTVAAGGHPLVWETNPSRHDGADGYEVAHPDSDQRRDYRVICDVSGAADLTDTLIARLARGGELILAGFYDQPIQFNFPPAFMREAGIKIAAEWTPDDLATVQRLISDNRLRLDGLITHVAAAADAPGAYRTAFTEPACLKMILDWSQTS